MLGLIQFRHFVFTLVGLGYLVSTFSSAHALNPESPEVVAMIEKDHAHLVAGLTHEELPAIASKLDAAVVVMGAVARSSWKRLFIGATAERTLEDLPCDLLIIKPDWFQTPVALESHEAA